MSDMAVSIPMVSIARSRWPLFLPGELFVNGEDGVWYDPSDISTLFQDDAGATPVTADGDPVGRMEDKSGNGYHATQATAGLRPTYRTDGTLHWLEFDTADDLLVAAIDMVGVYDYAVGYEPSGNDFIAFHRQPNNTGGWLGIGQSGSALTGLDDASGTQNAAYFDGVLSTATTRGEQFTLGQDSTSLIINYNLTATGVSLKFLSIGVFNATYKAIGKIYGVICREGTFTAAERSHVASHLQRKAAS